ncbi:nuclear transport factor 2 family protein [uncultured Aeromicrobium sp.]|uniref:nuclear transport factor 2 family protein n=1 Tax=uncultured Aeromicrobium sp. TaxID=337820 RepID=UPI0025F6BD6D|nr:nuclear transport factor 2 family protein [uncultured Aeromicrobium sp.]
MSDLTLDGLLDLEHRGWEALTSSRGGIFYGELMTPEAVMILVNGMVLDRPTIAQTLNDSPPWSSYRLENPRLVPTSETSAALVYTATAHRDGQDEPFVALMSSHYRVLDDQLRLTLYQQTTITHGAY